MKNKVIIGILLLISLVSSATQQPKILLNFSVVDSNKTISVEILDSVSGVPVPNLTVSFFVNRSFGLLPIGDDVYTDSSGNASFIFDFDISTYDASGKIFITVITEETSQYAEGKFSSATSWGRYIIEEANSNTNYLWSPNAPLPLVLTFTILLGGIWLMYLYVGVLLYKIKNAKD